MPKPFAVISILHPSFRVYPSLPETFNLVQMKNPGLFSLAASALLLTGCQTQNKTAIASAPVPVSTPVPSTANLAGDWHWVCCGGSYHGELKLQQSADKITGRLFDADDTTGGAVEGSISGSMVQFTRTWGDNFSQDYKLTLSADGSKLAGDIEGTRDEAVSAHFEATRK